MKVEQFTSCRRFDADAAHIYRRTQAPFWSLFRSNGIASAASGTLSYRITLSLSRRDVLRGLHGDARMAKLVSVLRGSAYDVIVDVRAKSATYGQWHGTTSNGRRWPPNLRPPRLSSRLPSARRRYDFLATNRAPHTIPPASSASPGTMPNWESSGRSVRSPRSSPPATPESAPCALRDRNKLAPA